MMSLSKIWCQFISRSEGAPIDESVNWNEVCSKPVIVKN